jgi:hypothetical protein
MDTHPLPLTTTMEDQIQNVIKSEKRRCSNCKGTGKAGQIIDPIGRTIDLDCAECIPIIEEKIKLISCGIPITFLEIDEVSNHLSKKDKKFVSILKDKIQENPEKMRFISLSSDWKGVGKTGTIAYLVKFHLRELIKKNPRMESMPITWVNAGFLANKLYGELKNNRSDEEKQKAKEFMDSVKMNHILVIDGLGDHYIKPSGDGDEQWISSKFEEIFRYRSESGLSIYCTSNYRLLAVDSEKPNKDITIHSKYGERFVGLWSMSDFIWYDWKTTEDIRRLETTGDNELEEYRSN